MTFQPFQRLYSQLKQTDSRLYDAMERISLYLGQLTSSVTDLQSSGSSSRLLQANGVARLLTVTFDPVDSAWLLLDRSGLWYITGYFHFLANNGCGICQGQLEFNGGEFNGLTPPATEDYAVLSPAVGVSVEIITSTSWRVENTGNSYVKLLARKTAAGGAGSAVNKNTKIFAQFIG